MSTNIEEKNKIINSLCNAFEAGRSEPFRYISTLLKVPETEELLARESLGQKFKEVGAFLAAGIPIIISIIELLKSQFHIF
jgi:hypothetical protein